MSASVKNDDVAPAPGGAAAGARLELPYLKEFGILMAAWVALFHFLGNSTLGYVDTSSLFGWWKWTIGKTPTEQHAFFIPFVVVGLIYYRRAQLGLVPKGLWWPALAVIGLALLFHLLGYLIQQGRVSVMAFSLGVFGVTGLFWGWRWMRATLLPFGLLFFCVPLGPGVEPLTFPLRLLATHITSTACRTILGIDVIQRGNQLFDAGGEYQYEVAAACSGIQSLTAIAIFSMIYAFLSFRSPWRILLVLLSGLPMAVVANVARLMMIVVAAEVFGQRAGDVVHDNGFFSMLPYIPAIAGVMLVGRLLREKAPAGATGASGDSGGSGAPRRKGVGSMRTEARQTKGATVALIAGLILIGAAGWFLSRMQGLQRMGPPGVRVVACDVFGETGTVVATNAVDLPLNVPGYAATNLPIARVELDWLPPDTTFGRAAYAAPDGFQAVMSAVLMGSDRTSIHKPEYCLTGQGFKIESQSFASVPIPEPVRYELPVMKMITTREAKLPDGTVLRNRMLYVFWFVADQRLSADHNKRMLSMAWDLVTTGVMQRWAYISCLAECEIGQEDQLFARMSELIAAAVPRFQLTTGKEVRLAAEP